MRTPAEFLSKYKQTQELCQDRKPDALVTHKCQNCSAEFAHRTRGGNIFCSNKCRGQITQNLRSTIRRVKSHLELLPRDNFPEVADQSTVTLAANLLACLPATTTARQEVIWRELRELDELMLTVGPIDPGTRQLIRTCAAAIASILRLERFRDSFDRRLFIHARELLRDVGIESPITTEKIRELLGHAEAAVSFFMETRDHINMLSLGRALMAWGNTCRILGDERAAAQRFNWAYDVLTEGPYRRAPQDNSVAWYVHVASGWRLRSRGRLMGFGERRNEIARMARLAQQINDPRLWLIHYRDAAGHASFLLNDRNTALKRMDDMNRARKELSSQYLDVTLLRPRIELLFEINDDEEAIELVREKYVRLYSHHRDAYYHKLLLEWSKEHKFELSVPLLEPEYLSPLLTFLPRRLERPLV